MPQMFPMDPLRNITFLVLDIDQNVGGPHMFYRKPPIILILIEIDYATQYLVFT